jgi:hypothetical protein
MSSPTQDVLALVRHLLVEDQKVSARVEDRVTGPAAPRSGSESEEDLYPRIVLEIMGGQVFSSGALQVPIIHVYAYSRVSQSDALAIFDLIRPVLRMARLARDGIPTKGLIRETTGPMTGFNPEVGSWFVRGTYRVNALNLTPQE